MGIFDFLRRDKDEEKYKGITLVDNVDIGLQKNLIDRGRSNEIQGLQRESVSFFKELDESGQRLGDAFGQGVKQVAGFGADVAQNIGESTANVIKQTGRQIGQSFIQTDENQQVTGGVLDYLDKPRQMLEGEIPQGEMSLGQRVAGGAFHTFTQVGKGIAQTAESALRGFQWLGLEEAKPYADKLNTWTKVLEPENATFADKLSAGLGSAIAFYLPGFGIAKGSSIIAGFSPRIALWAGSSASTAFEALSEAGDTYQSTLEEGHKKGWSEANSKEVADARATGVFFLNSALIGLTNKLGIFGEQKTILKKMLMSAPVEGFQEFGQQVIQNVAAGKKWDEGAYEAGAIGTLLGGLLGGVDFNFDGESETQAQTRIIDGMKIKDEVIESRLRDMAGKVGRIETGQFVFDTELGQKIMDLKSGELIRADSVGQFYRAVAKVVDNSKLTNEQKQKALGTEEGLAGTVKDMLSELKADDALIEQLKQNGMSLYESDFNEVEAAQKVKNQLKVDIDTATKIVGFVQDTINGEKVGLDEELKAIVDDAKLKMGGTPSYIEDAVKQAGMGMQITAEEVQPDNVKLIPKSFAGFTAVEGVATFTPAESATAEGVSLNASDYKFRRFTSAREQQAYLNKYKADTLAQAVRKEGKFDGYVVGDLFAIVNTDKVSENVKKQQFIPTEKAHEMATRFPFIQALDIPVLAKKRIITQQGQEAFGQYFDGVISFVENPHKTTLPHEALHAFLDLMLEPEQKQNVLGEVKRRYKSRKYNDQQAEERLAQDFAEYYIQKFDKGEQAKAPSSKLKRFFDWLIKQFKTLTTGKTPDKIKELYKAIETEVPEVADRRVQARNLTNRSDTFKSLQYEYYQQPDKLTSKFLELPDIKGREFASYKLITERLKGAGLKLAEYELIQDVLDTQFKDNPKINIQDFADAVKGELMPLDIIFTDTYADYGASNIGMDFSRDGEGDPYVTHVFNSPFKHGISGHFGRVFEDKIENIGDGVREKYTSDSGLFGHVRTWDNPEEKDLRYIAEIQSDAYQGDARALRNTIQGQIKFQEEEVKRIKEDINSRQEILDTRQEQLPKLESDLKKSTTEEKKDKFREVIEDVKKDILEKTASIKSLVSGMENHLQEIQSLQQQLTKPDEKVKLEKNFLAYKNIWHERMIREELRIAAIDGIKTLRFPTPRTVSFIEGYVSENGGLPYELPVGHDVGTDLEQGDYIDYLGESHIVVAADPYGITIAREENVNIFSDYEARQEDIQNKWEEIKYQWDELQKKHGNINTMKKLEAVLKKEEEGVLENAKKGATVGWGIDHDLLQVLESIQENYAGQKFPKFDDLYDDWFEKMESTYEPDYEGIYENVFYDERSENDKTVYAVSGEVENLEQPDRYEADGGTEEDFDIEKLESQEQRTVAKFYEQKVYKYLTKIRDNVRKVEDDRGYSWYEIDVRSEDRAAVAAFQTKDSVVKKKSLKRRIAELVGLSPREKVGLTEQQLLKLKLRAMAKGAKIGKAYMRQTLGQAFAEKKAEIQDIKDAIVAYAQDLPLSERGKLLTLVKNAKTKLNLEKAFDRIDVALQRVDKTEAIQDLKKIAKEVRSSAHTGRGIAVDYQKRLLDVLDNYDLKKPTERTMERLKALQTFLQAQPEAERPAIVYNEEAQRPEYQTVKMAFVPPYLVQQLDRLTKQNINNMTADQVRELNDTLYHLMMLGRLKNDLKYQNDERQKQAAIERLVQSTINVDPKGEKRFDLKKSYLELLHAFRVTDRFDNEQDYRGQNTQIQRTIARSVNSAEVEANATLSDVFERIRDVKKKWSKDEQAALMFHLLVDQGAYDQAQALIYSEGWKKMPEKTQEMEYAMDIMRGAFDGRVAYLASVFEEINNKPFPAVANYFPLKYQKGKTLAPDPIIGQQFQIRSKQTTQGFTFARKRGVKKVPRTDVFAVFEEAIREQMYYSHVQPTLLEAHALVTSDAYQAKAGEIATNWWKDYIDAVAHRGQQSGVRSSRWLAGARVNISRAILGYKLSSIVMQPLAIFDALAYAESRFGSPTAMRLLGHFAIAWVNPFYAKSVIRKSEALQVRQGGELTLAEINMRTRRKGVATGLKLGRRGLFARFQQNALRMLQGADLKTAASVDQAMYNTFRKKGLSDKEARVEADMVMNIVSGSSDIGDRPLVLTRGEGYRTLLTFQTFMLNRWGVISHDLIKAGLIRGTLGRKARSIIGLMILGIGMGAEDELREALYTLLTGKKYKAGQSFIKNALWGFPEAIPILGSFIRGQRSFGQGFDVPLTRTIENITIGARQLSSDKEESQKKGVLKILESIATLYGIAGTSQGFDILERIVVPPEATTSGEDSMMMTIPPSGIMPLPKLPTPPRPPKIPMM